MQVWVRLPSQSVDGRRSLRHTIYQDEAALTETTKQRLRKTSMVLQSAVATWPSFEVIPAQLYDSVARLFVGLPVCIGVHRQQRSFVGY